MAKKIAVQKHWTNDKMVAFRVSTIFPEDVPVTITRLVMLNTKPGNQSTYLVLASPDDAKIKRSHDGRTISVWPEVVVGIIAEGQSDGRQDDGSRKVWNVHPTLRAGLGWRKKKVMTVAGRDYAARYLLAWWAEQNEQRRNPETSENQETT